MTSSGQREAPIVDAHAHIFTNDMPMSSSAWFRPSYEFTAEQYLAALDAHGIHFGVISGISIFGLYNDYMLEQLRKHKRLRGTAIVAPNTDRYVLERMKADGVVGVRLQLTRRKELPDLANEEYQLLLRRLADLDLHVEVVVEGARWPAVLPKLEASGAKIVIDHFGHPSPDKGANCPGFQAVLRSVEKGRTWVKLSAAYRLTWAEAGQSTRDPASVALARDVASSLLSNAGPERLVWGSDCPFVGHEEAVTFDDTLNELAEWAPDAGTRRKISDTALKLYFS
ncbi:MAG: amidohydrolase family protein [Gammaproteobacteria bacterium]